MVKTFVLLAMLVGNSACSKLAWSKLLHGPLIDDGRLLIPALADIIFAREPDRYEPRSVRTSGVGGTTAAVY